MKPPKTSWKDRLLAGGAAVTALWLLSPTVSWAVDFSRNRHNTYKIYKHVFWHVLEGRNLYLPYPGKYGDLNLYGPLFSLIVAPFAVLPDVAGGLLWNVFMAALLYLAVGRIGLVRERRLLVLLVCAVELMNANWSNQFNPAIAALMLLTFASVEDGKDFVAPLWVLIGAFVKLYSVVGLVFLLFAKSKRAFLAGCVTWAVVLFLAPMVISSPEYVLQAYREWFVTLAAKNSHNVVLFTSQDISIPGFVRRAVGMPLSSIWFYLVGIPLVLTPFLRFGQYRHRQFRVLTVASLLMFIVLFSSGSESSTYVICATGAGLWLAQQEEPFRPRNALLIAALLLAGLAPTDLLSVQVRVLVNRYALKAVPYAIAWLLLCWDLLTMDFGRSTDFSGASAWGGSLAPAGEAASYPVASVGVGRALAAEAGVEAEAVPST
jgi:Glycosyltransferase family 87